VKSSFALATALATSMLLSACGQTGPLTMPKPPHRKGAAAPAAPAPAPASIATPPAPAAGTAMPSATSNANNTQATNPPSSVPASQ
jgi:predicted small lipoprotein YifL